MTADHAEQVLAIYQAGIDSGNATFETTAPGWETFDRAKLPGHRFIALEPATENVLGWIAASKTSERAVYAGVVEHSVYVHPEAQGRGVGAGLLQTLIASTESAGIWTIQSGVFPENTASLRLHKAAGFRTIGTRERVGQHRGAWRNVILTPLAGIGFPEPTRLPGAPPLNLFDQQTRPLHPSHEPLMGVLVPARQPAREERPLTKRGEGFRQEMMAHRG